MYVEKEKELMDAMKQTGFELFDGSSDDAYDTWNVSLWLLLITQTV